MLVKAPSRIVLAREVKVDSCASQLYSTSFHGGKKRSFCTSAPWIARYPQVTHPQALDIQRSSNMASIRHFDKFGNLFGAAASKSSPPRRLPPTGGFNGVFKVSCRACGGWTIHIGHGVCSGREAERCADRAYCLHGRPARH